MSAVEVAKFAKSKSPEEHLANRVLNFIRKHRYAYFSDLACEFREFRDGTCALEFVDDAHANIFAWANMTETAHKAMSILQRRGVIRYRPLDDREFRFYGLKLDLPLACKPAFYRKPHWLPTAIELTQ